LGAPRRRCARRSRASRVTPTRKPLGYGGFRMHCRRTADGICSRRAFIVVTLIGH
jgi:hypothetical protein